MVARGGGSFETFEDVLFSIMSKTTDMGVEAGIASIDNVQSHSAAVTSAVFQARFWRTPACYHGACMFAVGITSGLE